MTATRNKTTDEQKREVIRLAKQGRSQRTIAALTGVERSVVGRIVRATLGSTHADKTFKQLKREDLFGVQKVATSRFFSRCPTCGGMVRKPCVKCSLEGK